jgi:PAS domain S-box-containing protein
MSDSINFKNNATDFNEGQFLLSLFENYKTIMLLIHPQTGEILAANQSAVKFYGYSRKQLLSMKIQQINTLSEEETGRLRNLALEKGIDSILLSHRLANGEIRSVEVHSAPVQYGDENVLFLIIHDVTHQQLDEQELIKKEKLFHTLFEQAINAILLVDRDGNILEVNNSACRTFRYEVSEFLHLGIRDLVSHLPAQENFEFTKMVKNCNKHCEHLFIRKDSTNFFGRVDIIQLSNSNYQFFIRDITEQKNTQESLRRSSILFSTIFEQSPIPISLADLETEKYLEVNPAFLSMTGYKREEVVGHEYKELNYWVNSKQRRHVISLLRHNKKVRNLPIEIQTKQNEIKNNLISSEMISLDNHPYFLTMGIEVTRRVQENLELRHKTEDLELINEMNAAINRGEKLKNIIQKLAVAMKTAFLEIEASIFMLAPDEKNLESAGTTFTVSPEIRKYYPQIEILLTENPLFPISGSKIIKKVIESKQPVLLDNQIDVNDWIQESTQSIIAHSDEAKLNLNETIRGIYQKLGIGFVFLIPLVSEKKVIGSMNIISVQKFNKEDIERIVKISNQVTAAIIHKKTEEDMLVQLKRIKVLNEINRAINSNLNLNLILDLLVKRLRSQLNVDATAILLKKPFSSQFEIVADDGIEAQIMENFTVNYGHGLAGNVAVERKILVIDDLRKTDTRYDLNENLIKEGFISFIGVPLISKGNIKGVIDIFNRQPIHIDSSWMEYLEILGEQAAIAIENAQSFEEIQASNQELIAAYNATIAGWSRALDLRDKETEGHSQRVTKLTLQLAEAVGLPQEQMIQIRRGTLLHDIGKIGVPDSILHKPGPLNEEEWKVMRSHPQVAYDLLSDIDYLRGAISIPYCHHEKWDGSGYPRGLKGEEIPIEARIFSVADAWDALTNDRPYRSAWSKEKVIEYLQNQAGIAYDPQIVKIFLKQIIQ